MKQNTRLSKENAQKAVYHSKLLPRSRKQKFRTNGNKK